MTTNDLDTKFLRLVPSGEVYLKSRRTLDRFMRLIVANLRRGLELDGIEASVRRSGHHELSIVTSEYSEAAEVAARTFGVNRVERVQSVRFDSLEQLSKLVDEMWRERVRGHTFAFRVRRRGTHEEARPELEQPRDRWLVLSP